MKMCVIAAAALAVSGLALAQDTEFTALLKETNAKVGSEASRSPSASHASGGSWLDELLDIERARGFAGCFLAPARLAVLRSTGWTVLSCGADHAVASRKVAGADAPDRRPDVLTVLRAAAFPDDVARIGRRPIDRISADVERAARSRFRVPTEATDLSVFALVDGHAKLFGQASIRRFPNELYEFKYADNPVPQTTAWYLERPVVLKLQTTSTDFRAVEADLQTLARLNWEILPSAYASPS